jgi:hypothetical protein
MLSYPTSKVALVASGPSTSNFSRAPSHPLPEPLRMLHSVPRKKTFGTAGSRRDSLDLLGKAFQRLHDDDLPSRPSAQPVLVHHAPSEARQQPGRQRARSSLNPTRAIALLPEPHSTSLGRCPPCRWVIHRYWASRQPPSLKPCRRRDIRSRTVCGKGHTQPQPRRQPGRRVSR